MKKFDRSLSQKLLLVTIAVLSVAGCASKSSSSDSSSVTAFSQWSAVTGGSTIIATGFSAQRTYVTDSSGNYQLVGNASQSTSNNATYTIP